MDTPCGGQLEKGRLFDKSVVDLFCTLLRSNMSGRTNFVTEEIITMKKGRERAIGFTAGILVMLLLFSVPAALGIGGNNRDISVLYGGVRLVVHGEEIIPQDVNGRVVQPFVYQGSTYLPVRAVSEALGYMVDWDGSTRTVFISNESEQAQNVENQHRLCPECHADDCRRLLGYDHCRRPTDPQYRPCPDCNANDCRQGQGGCGQHGGGQHGGGGQHSPGRGNCRR